MAFGGFGAAPAAAPPPPDRTPQAAHVQLAQGFWAAYSGALAAPNAQQLGALYGADSVLSFDGQVAEGHANILAQVITPRVRRAGARVCAARARLRRLDSVCAWQLQHTCHAGAAACLVRHALHCLRMLPPRARQSMTTRFSALTHSAPFLSRSSPAAPSAST